MRREKEKKDSSGMCELPPLKPGAGARVALPPHKWSFEEHGGSPVSEIDLCLHRW